jgi:diaminopimelate epimerase
MQFHKYHALGNDYLVLPPEAWSSLELTPAHVQRLCHRHLGLSSDGILWEAPPQPNAHFGLRIFNPDGSEAEKSGNGLRIFCRYLWDQQRVTTNETFVVSTLGGNVSATVHDLGAEVTVEMGRVSFLSDEIPVTGSSREVLLEDIELEGQTWQFSAATIGNPHCVLRCEAPDSTLACRLGSLLEKDQRFPQRTNVQFVKVLDRKRIYLEIWERGAGYTLASGSSSSAAAAVCHRLGWCDANIQVHMPGGTLQITLDAQFQVTMRGAVTRVSSGTAHHELFTYPFPTGA